MIIIRKILGPKSKYDPTIPYTYKAEINVLQGVEADPLFIQCFADTLCGLVAYLDEHNYASDEVTLYEITTKREEKIRKELCVNKKGEWLSRPAICHSLEGNYRGHIDEKRCSYRDRDRQGSGLV